MSCVDTANPSARAADDRRLVHLHHSAVDPEPACRSRRRRGPMKHAIDALPYAGLGEDQVAIQAPFWEEDEAIYGGISYTDLPIRQYRPIRIMASTAAARASCSAPICSRAPICYEFTAMTPAERVASAVEFGATDPSAIPKGVRDRRRGGAGIACPSTLGCASEMERMRAAPNITAISARSTAASRWRASTPRTCSRGRRAILSALDAISRLHERVVKT